jgi:sarcosine oxidase subunit gamma
MNFAEPNSRLRRSPLYRRHLMDGGAFVEVGDQLLVGHYKDADIEVQIARRLSLCDISTLARGGLAGSGASAYLASGYVDLPATHNDSRRQMNGDTVARLAENEYLHLGSSALFGTVSDVPAWAGNPEVKAYSLPRRDSHCWFALTGTEAAITLSKLCAIDFREHKFADGRVAQTSLARVSAIIVRGDLGETPAFFILASSSATEYLWDCLIDAM